MEKMVVDIIILSHARTQKLLELTQKTIDSCHASEKEIQFNVLVIEQEPGIVYNNCKTMLTDSPFNYNGFMNLGISLTENKYVCLCNNDLIFCNGWDSNMIEAMERESILSACPLCPDRQGKDFWQGYNIEYGYNNGKHMSGWCIMINRKLIDKIGKLDEDFPFWFADNAYAEQLKKHNVKHALIRNSVVKHLGSSTLSIIDSKLHEEYTNGQVRKFIAKYPDNESSIHFKKVLKL